MAIASCADFQLSSSVKFWQLLANGGKLVCALDDASHEVQRLKDEMRRASLEGRVHVLRYNCSCTMCDINRECFHYNGPHGGWKVVALVTTKSSLKGAADNSLFNSHSVTYRELTESEYARKCKNRDDLPTNAASNSTHESASPYTKQIRPVTLGKPVVRKHRVAINND